MAARKGCPTFADVAAESGYSVFAVERAFDTRPNLRAKHRVALHAGLAIMDAAERLSFVPENRKRRRAVGEGER